jgi:carboxymethylenebutenolidase
MSTSRPETITAPDGQTFDAHVVLPASGSGPGMLVLQEIFGVNVYVRDVCERLAALGYVAMAPDVFWRVERNVELGHGPDDLQKAYGYISSYDFAAGVPDLVAAFTHLQQLPEVTGGHAGVIGFCFGGVTSYLVAANANPEVVVSYYGSGVPDMLAAGDSITAPVLFHFGTQDPFIPTEKVDAVAAFAAAKDNMTCRLWESGHAFDNSFSEMFSDPTAAAPAWAETVAFLQQHLPVER